jgi:hypothetical protein
MKLLIIQLSPFLRYFLPLTSKINNSVSFLSELSDNEKCLFVSWSYRTARKGSFVFVERFLEVVVLCHTSALVSLTYTRRQKLTRTYELILLRLSAFDVKI